MFPAYLYARHAELRDAGPLLGLAPVGTCAMTCHAEVKGALADASSISLRGVRLADFLKEEPWRLLSLLLEANPLVHSRTLGLMNRIIALSVLKRLQLMWADLLVEVLVAKRRFHAVTESSDVSPMVVFPDTISLPVEVEPA